MMSTVCLRLCSFLFLVCQTASLNVSQIQVYPNTGGIYEVFLAQLKHQLYSFNATTAIDACRSLGVNIATLAQVETAQSNGLQTCRYGWVMEKVAVIPRLEKNPKCGKNNTGIIVWNAQPSQLFDVFCSSSTDQINTTTFTFPNMTSVSSGRTEATTMTPSIFLSTQLNESFLSSSPSPQPISTVFNIPVTPTEFSSTVIPLSTERSQTSPPFSSLTSTGHQSTISSTFSTSFSSTVLPSHPFTNSSPSTIYPTRYEHSPSKKGFSFGAVSMACVVLVVIVLMMAGAGAVWYFKIKRPQRGSQWERICHNDMFETEMWKKTGQQSFNMQNDTWNYVDEVTLQMEGETISS